MERITPSSIQFHSTLFLGPFRPSGRPSQGLLGARYPGPSGLEYMPTLTPENTQCSGCLETLTGGFWADLSPGSTCEVGCWYKWARPYLDGHYTHPHVDVNASSCNMWKSMPGEMEMRVLLMEWVCGGNHFYPGRTWKSLPDRCLSGFLTKQRRGGGKVNSFFSREGGLAMSAWSIRRSKRLNASSGAPHFE